MNVEWRMENGEWRMKFHEFNLLNIKKNGFSVFSFRMEKKIKYARNENFIGLGVMFMRSVFGIYLLKRDVEIHCCLFKFSIKRLRDEYEIKVIK